MEKKFLQGLSQLATFLGGKLDALSTNVKDGFSSLSTDIKAKKQEVTLNINSKEIDQLRLNLQTDIRKVIGALEKVGTAGDRNLKALTTTVQASLTAIDTALRVDKGDGQALAAQGEKLAGILTAADKILSKIPETQSYKAELAGILAAIKANQPRETHPTDLTPVVAAISAHGTALAGLKGAIAASDPKDALAAILVALKGFELTLPKVFKVQLDETQLRSIRSSSPGGGAAPRVATRVTMANVAMTSANTEYSYTLPANTVSWTMKLRAQGVLLLYSFATGTLPTSGDGSAYATVPQNFVQSQGDVEWSGKTIYLQAPSASQVAEITSYSM